MTTPSMFYHRCLDRCLDPRRELLAVKRSFERKQYGLQTRGRKRTASAGDLPKRKERSGTILLVVMIITLIVMMLGLVLAEVTSRDMSYSVVNWQREQALAAADAGLDDAIWLLRNTAPDGSTTGTWRTAGYGPFTLPGSKSTWTVSVQSVTSGPWSGDVKITSTGHQGSDTVTVQAIDQVYAENLSPWANAIFAGSGQSGHAITGNVTIHGSVHILGDGEPFTDVNGNGQWDASIVEPYVDTNGNGQYDPGEPYTDLNNNGVHDNSVPEPYIDVNGDGQYTGPLTTSQFAVDAGGTSAVYNNYENAPASFGTTANPVLPPIPQVNIGGTLYNTLHANMRVKNGEVQLFGNAQIGQTSPSAGDKGTIDGSYVSNGYASGAASSVHSDNGTSHVYDLPNGLVTFPALFNSTTVNNVYYSDWLTYISAISYHYTSGDLTLDQATAGTQASPLTVGDATNGLTFYTNNGGTYLNIHGIVQVTAGNVTIGDAHQTITYTGTGTIVAKGSIVKLGDITTVLNPGTITLNGSLLASGTYPSGGFPTNAIGLISPGGMVLEQGGDTQATIMGALFAEGNINFAKQTQIAGACVASTFSTAQVPDIFQVPELANHLPPGLPGSAPIWFVQETLEGYYVASS